MTRVLCQGQVLPGPLRAGLGHALLKIPGSRLRGFRAEQCGPQVLFSVSIAVSGCSSFIIMLFLVKAGGRLLFPAAAVYNAGDCTERY